VILPRPIDSPANASMNLDLNEERRFDETTVCNSTLPTSGELLAIRLISTRRSVAVIQYQDTGNVRGERSLFHRNMNDAQSSWLRVLKFCPHFVRVLRKSEGPIRTNGALQGLKSLGFLGNYPICFRLSSPSQRGGRGFKSLHLHQKLQ
jgi:hypothetical protein